jgi:HK97 gp10 family phage protein
MNIQIKVTNLKKVLSQLNRLQKDMEVPFQEVVKGGGQLIRGEAIKSIQAGGKSGIVYQKYNPRREHRASAPGQAPASDTGNLVSKITVKQKSKDIVNVESNANYSAYLEYGTSRMQPRPFMLPAFEKSKKPIINAVFNRVKRKIQEYTK